MRRLVVVFFFFVVCATKARARFLGEGEFFFRSVRQRFFPVGRDVNTHDSDRRSAFEAFIAKRCGKPFTKEGVAVWHAQGELSDPATGTVHAEVIGAEVVSRLSSGKNISSFALGRCYKYLSPNKEAALKDIHQPSPYAAVIRHSLRDDGFVDSEAIMSTKRIVPSVAKFSHDPETKSSRFDTYLSPEGQSPKKAPLIQVGGSAPQKPAVARASRGLRCRETYTLHNDVITYTRFGECPAWLGPGKLCALDVSIRRPKKEAPSTFRDLEAQARTSLSSLLAQGSHLSPFVSSQQPDPPPNPGFFSKIPFFRHKNQLSPPFPHDDSLSAK